MASTSRKRGVDSTAEQTLNKRLRTEPGQVMTSGTGIPVSGSSDATPQDAQPDPVQGQCSVQNATEVINGPQGDVENEGEPADTAEDDENTSAGPSKPSHKIRKLVPPRPFPTVPPSVSATGPRSAHSEGKNYICVTRKTPLGAYLRRCKDVVLKDGYKSLHLSAMGAAIPHLMQLALSVPGILPHAPDEIRTDVLTGTVQVQDELIPDDEDEDISYQTRGKSTLSVVITIRDGVDETAKRGTGRSKGKQAQSTVAAAGGNAPRAQRAGGGRNKKKNASLRTDAMDTT